MLTIGITTFKHRFDQYLVPLLNTIKTIDKDIEVIIAINGEHKEPFDNKYRRSVLEFISKFDNTFPIIYPTFRSLSKMWNNIIINSTNDYILLLNDDVTITDVNFINNIKGLANSGNSFKINGSWSHAVLYKWTVETLNWFDERLLGIGEEDGDFEWRYQEYYNQKFENKYTNGIVNHVDMSHAPLNITAGSSGKYSKFNRETLFNIIYSIDNNRGKSLGMIGEKLIYNSETAYKQYPYEWFYEKNKEKL